jgi:carboxypeptidase T
MKKLLKYCTLSVLLLASMSFADSDTSYLITIKPTNFKKELLHYRQNGFDVAGVDLKNQTIDLVVDEELYLQMNATKSLSMVLPRYLSQAPDSAYKTSTEIAQILQDFASRYPLLTKLETIGKSLEGRDILALKITTDAQNSSSNKPTVFFNGMHHAREVMTPEIAIDIIEYLTSNYMRDAEVTTWLEKIEIWIVPMINVDGNNIVWNKDNMWRKNARPKYGVDINRNYPQAWGTCQGSSSNPSAQDYRGPSAASEPETNVIMNFVSKIKPIFSISYHSYSEIVIYPYGCNGVRVPTADVVEGIGAEIGESIGYKPGTSWELLYSTDGGDIDWYYAAEDVIPYVIEVNSSLQGFQPSYRQWRDKTVELNRAGWKLVLNKTLESGIRGQLTQDNKALLHYKIEISKNNARTKSYYHTVKSKNNGFYHIVLKPGQYSLKFIDMSGKMLKEIEVQVSEQLKLMDLRI